MPVRLQDIANDLDLSKMTISKVLRGQAGVSAATKARVLQRMKELNYRPNITARSLATGRTFTLGLVIPSLTDPFFGEVANGISTVIAEENYGMVVASTGGDGEQEKHEIERQLSRQVDALIVASQQASGEFFRQIDSRNIPLILIDRRIPDFNGCFVGVREEMAVQLATEHLIEQGCKAIAYLCHAAPFTAGYSKKGYSKALEAHGLSFRSELVVEIDQDGLYSDESGAESMRQLLQSRRRPDGVVCCSDFVAAGAMEAILQSGLKIPEDMAVIGSGNSFCCRWMKVPLSSVDRSLKKIGEKSAELAMKLIASDDMARHKKVLLSPQVIARASTLRAVSKRC